MSQNRLEVLTQKHGYAATLTCVVVVSIALRAARFAEIPQGLAPDEVSAAYEAWSLLATGADRWGNPFPVYFVAWGYGQNTLYSYLCIPFFALWGASEFTFRLPSLLLGLGTIALLYVLYQKQNTFDKRAALVVLLLVGLSPWHVVLSRWGLEPNLLPFWLVLHVTLFRYMQERLPAYLWVSFIPLVWAGYTYALVLVSLPLYFILLIGAMQRGHWKPYLLGILAFFIGTLPLQLFLAKYYFFPSISTSFLGMTLPTLLHWPATFSESIESVWHTNLQFIFAGFHDYTLSNTTFYTVPHNAFVLVLSFLGISYAITTLKKSRSARVWLFLWIVGWLPFLFFRMNLNRSLVLQTAIIGLAIEGGYVVLHILQLAQKPIRKACIGAVLVFYCLHTAWFAIDYFRFYPDNASTKFQSGLGEVLQKVQHSEIPTYLSPRIVFPYLYVAFYTRIPPKEFQKETPYIYGSQYQLRQLRAFHFLNTADEVAEIPSGVRYIAPRQEPIPFTQYTVEYETQHWRVVKKY